ncbi:MAG TPA: prolyl oligopeptidase family serine peptidase [Bacteroidia bacterium]|nr:prolyl oligopeptidase family serine peptidase [Bacteroidia bacterium]
MKPLIAIFLISITNFCLAQNNDLIKLQKSNFSYQLNNKKLIDEYANLDTASNERQLWLNAQQNNLKKYKAKLNNQNTYDKITDLNFYINSSYTILGKYFFKVFYNDNGQGIYKSNHISHADLLVNGKDIISNINQTVLFRALSISGNMNYLGYSYSINGSDHLNIKIFNLKSNSHLKDKLTDIDWKEIQWYKDGFFYSKFDSTSVYYHQLNTNSSEDSIVIPSNKSMSMEQEFMVLNNERYLILKVNNLKTKQTSTYFTELNNGNFQFKPLIIKNENKIDFITASDSLIYFTASYGEYKNNLFYIHPANPKNWHLLIKQEANELLNSVKILSNRIIASFKNGPKENLKVYDLKGNLLANIELPIGYSISNIQGIENANNFYFDLISFCLPALTYEYNITKNKYEALEGVYVNFDSEKYELISSHAVSFDGTQIPLLIAKSKSIKFQNAPTLLESYGGYGINFENHFRADLLDFMDKGGVYVRAYIRGGGEQGEDWHKEGSGIKKSNTYNDFISCAKHLIKNKNTSPSKLAVRGGSHGGLVVGVAITQSPELFKAAICTAAPLNIVGLLHQKKSFFQFNEYGNINDSFELDSLIKYDPYFNIKPNINYPSMFIYASDHDERVPWTNSAKFVAKLQNRQNQTNPILFLLEKDAGHFGAEKSYEKVIMNYSFQNRFLYEELGMD